LPVRLSWSACSQGRHRRGQVGGGTDGLGSLAGRLDRDHVVRLDLIRGDVHLLAVDKEVGVTDQLACLASRCPEPEAVDYVVESRLEQAEEVLTSDAGASARLHVVAVELLLEHLVVAPRLLFLAELEKVLGLLDATAAVLARRIRAALDGAFVGEAAFALEEQLDALTTTLLALC
jgi:hypothetical protein